MDKVATRLWDMGYVGAVGDRLRFFSRMTEKKSLESADISQRAT